ncbi:MAG: hypothetical protein BGO41_05680 [Clostridiales bacterium 38-18]|nr:MAG: hypothetical protein BGO41_05680 [Clostridiales bacterium 38-18]
MRLSKALEQIGNEKLVSFHMPGHKNGSIDILKVHSVNLLSYDITEIPGADHLHGAEGCIKETEIAIAEFYNAFISKMLINGSTVGLLSAIMGVTAPGDQILVNRNAHKSIYNAIEMHRLDPVYLFPIVDDRLGIPIDLTLDTVGEAISSHPNVKACVLTYPTYEGLCYDIRAIIALCHENNILVIVDEAHGPHLLLNKTGPKSALELGADLVIQSFHKTMPSVTQTAVLHISKNHILSNDQLDRLNWHLGALQSSSPSYLLMYAMDQMLYCVEKDGIELMQNTLNWLEAFYNKCSSFKHLEVFTFKKGDPTKFVITFKASHNACESWSISDVTNLLRRSYQIQSEYDSERLILMMASIANSESDYIRLYEALKQIDQEIATSCVEIYNEKLKGEHVKDEKCEVCSYDHVYESIKKSQTKVYNASDVIYLKSEDVAVTECVGRIAKEYIIPYPPGIPILVPGERIIEATLALFPVEIKRVKCLLE